MMIEDSKIEHSDVLEPSSLDLNDLGSVSYLRQDLEERLGKYQLDAYNYKKHEKYFNNIYRGLGYPGVVIGIVISILFGSSGFMKPYNTISIVGFCLGLVQTILSSTLIFFNIQGTSNKYHDTSGQLSDLYKDLRVFLLYERTFDELEEMETLLLEKEKFIDSYSPNLSGIVGVKKKCG